MAKKLFMAQKRGETRAICLGIGMIICSVMMFFLLGVTFLPKYLKSVWTAESMCTLVQATLKESSNCIHNSNTKPESIVKYPCLKVLVNLNFSEDIFMLYHTEESPDWNNKCSYIPECKDNFTEVAMHVQEIQGKFNKTSAFTCYFDPKGKQRSTILIRKFGPQKMISYFFWPTSMFTVGICMVVIVKMNQYFAMVTVQAFKTNS
ncbi:calcium-activated potassium channel subunit beta-1 [Gastrophryne carolinensis]